MAQKARPSSAGMTWSRRCGAVPDCAQWLDNSASACSPSNAGSNGLQGNASTASIGATGGVARARHPTALVAPWRISC